MGPFLGVFVGQSGSGEGPDVTEVPRVPVAGWVVFDRFRASALAQRVPGLVMFVPNIDCMKGQHVWAVFFYVLKYLLYLLSYVAVSCVVYICFVHSFKFKFRPYCRLEDIQGRFWPRI